MKKYIILLLTVMSIINILGQKMNYQVIPTPQKIIKKDSFFVFDERTIINLDKEKNSSYPNALKFLRNSLSEILNRKIELKNDETSQTHIILKYVDESKLPEFIPSQFNEEAYILRIDENKIVIEASTEKGLFYGCTTLIQLVENTEEDKIPCCKIYDWPNMKFRGISDDISRGQVSTLENFKRLIKFISRYKMNTYMPYLEDMIQFDSYPSIGKNRGALSKKEIEEIIEYANDHFVEVIPVFQTLGHFENILSQKEFIKYADWPGAASLDITNKETYEFLNTLLEEVFEIFPSKYFHIGADESYDVGFGNSRELADSIGLAAIHANHYKKIYDICKKHNKEVMMYGDILLDHPEILENIPKDIIIVDWHYFPKFDYPSTKLLNEAGFKYIVSPTVWNFNSSFPENYLAIPNIETITKSGIENNSIGMINSSWGDYGAETFRELNLYGYAWSAQCAWNLKESNVSNFNKNFFFDFYGSTNDEITNLYKELNDVNNQVVWNSFWRHPLLDFRKPDWREYNFPVPSKVQSMQDFQQKDFTNINVSKNAKHLELVKFSYRIKNYFLGKLKIQEKIHKIFNLKKSENTDLIHLIEENISTLRQLKNDFKELWLRTNKDANLWMIEEKFDRLIAYFEETISKIEKDDLNSVLIKSKCIFNQSDNDKPITNATFTKTIKIDEEINSAYLQFLAHGHAQLFINNKYVEEVYVKRSGSLWLEQQRVKLIDIKDFLETGNNEIKVSVKNYKNRTACLNLIAQLKTKSETKMFYSDENWKTYNPVSDEWINASVHKHEKIEIIEPNFNTLRKSWIER